MNEILTPVPLEQCGPGRVSWCHPSRTSELPGLLGGMVFVPEGTLIIGAAQLVRVPDPKASFIDFIIAGGYRPPQLFMMSERIPVIGKYCAIGGDGFGFHNGRRFPHIGNIEFGNDIEIGSNTCIDRGALGNTKIGDRTKIDNLVHIAHNVHIGTDCLIVAGSVIGGSATIGDRVFIGMNASIRNKVRIGNDVTIGMGSVVTKDVPDGQTWAGNPARPLPKAGAPECDPKACEAQETDRTDDPRFATS